MNFKNIQEAKKYFEKFKPITTEYHTVMNVYKGDRYDLEPGDIFLYEHHIYKDEKVTYPKLAIFVKYDTYDLASVYKFIEYPRIRANYSIGEYEERMYDVIANEIEEIISWNDEILILGIWEKTPHWKELKKAFEKSWYYYKPDYVKRNIIIENILKKAE